MNHQSPGSSANRALSVATINPAGHPVFAAAFASATKDELRLISLCDEYLAVKARYDAGEGPDGEGPLWDRMEALQSTLNDWEPATFAGALAAARVVKAIARLNPGATDPFHGAYIGSWGVKVVLALLHLAGDGSTPPSPLPPDSSNASGQRMLDNRDAELIALCGSLPQVLRDLASTPDDIAEDGPEWGPYDRIADTIGSWPATTLEGLIAKARAARVKATNEGHGEDPEPGGVVNVWAWAIVKDLLRMGGEA